MSKRLPADLQPLIQKLYQPDFDPQDLKLVSAVPLSKDDLEIIEARVKEVEKKLFSDEVPRPLTEDEAVAVEQKVDETRKAIAATRARISLIRARIDAQAAPDGQAEISFEVDLRKKGRLRRAIKKAFGKKPETLTYGMYKAALEAKRQLEDQEAENYTSGKWED